MEEYPQVVYILEKYYVALIRITSKIKKLTQFQAKEWSLMPKNKNETLCVEDLRHAEYYEMQNTFDDLYAKSKKVTRFLPPKADALNV